MTQTNTTAPPPQSTRTLLLRIWSHLNRRRIQLGLPFLALLSDPERLWQQPLVQTLAAVGSDLSCEAYRRTLCPLHAVDL